MSRPEYPQEGYGQKGWPHIRVDIMPDESREGQSPAPITETPKPKDDILKRLARSRVGRVVASLGLFGGAVAAPTAIDAARAFAEGGNRVEASLQQGELAQEFKVIAVSKEEAIANPIQPKVLTAIEKGNGSLIYLVPTLYDDQGNRKEDRLLISSPDANGLPKPWIESLLPEDFKFIKAMAALDKFVVVGGNDESYRAIAYYSDDEGKTFKKISLPEDASGQTTSVESVVKAKDTEYFLISDNIGRMFVFNPQLNKVTPVISGANNSVRPVVGSQSGVSLKLYSVALTGEESGVSGGVLREDVDLYSGTVTNSKVLAEELGPIAYVGTKTDENNILSYVYAAETLWGKMFKLNPETGEVLNRDSAGYNYWLKDKFPNQTDILNLGSTLDIHPNYEMFAGGMTGDSANNAVFVAREINTGEMISYVFEDLSDFLNHPSVLTKIGGKNRLLLGGYALIRVIPLNSDKSPLDTDNPETVYLGIKENAEPSPTATPTSTATPESNGDKQFFVPITRKNS